MRAVHVPHSTVPCFDAATPDAVVQQLAEIATVIDAW